MKKPPPPPKDNKTDMSFSPSETTIYERSEQQPIIPRVIRPYICIISPAESAAQFLLGDNPILIGRSDEADITIVDNRISRIHCRIEKNAQGILITDLNSTNGCVINGAEIKTAYLPLSGRLQLGDTVLKVEYKSSGEIHQEEQLRQAATVDQLTGIHNRQWIMTHAQHLVEEHQRRQLPLAVVMLDIDFFKGINDRYGHPCGDHVLREVAHRLSAGKRKSDLLGRYGGEEFIMLLAETTASEAFALCDRLRLAICDFSVEYKDESIDTSVSIGIFAAPNRSTFPFQQLTEFADTALYQAKQQGRNRVIISPNSESPF
ncbi:MAG: GGDEF domain-containing protein [Gammaproteobacteria bacterium]|nr:GGDEF domain-containing protein [Gammaproteobacteria bacterium]